MLRQKELKMTFDPNTIEHLGVRMYSTLPPVLTELIGNAHDADAEHVILTLKDAGGEKEIVIEDDGIGMSFDEINNKFLRIGRNRRVEDKAQTTPKGRKIIGKKGLGKLSFFGIAHEIEITTKKDGKENVFVMSWEGIKSTQKEYKPKIIKKDETCPADSHGTKIVLRKIQRESDFSSENLANSLSKMFIFDTDFRVEIRHNEEEPIIVSNERRYAGLEKEVEWKVPSDVQYTNDYDKADQIVGHLMATKKPISPKTNMRGIILFSRKKLVNMPEYFSESTSSHFFSYLTGWLEVDFIDELEDDVIATNRQSLNWGHPEMKKLRLHLQNMIKWLEQDWRKKRAEIRNKELENKTGIKISEWRAHIPENINKDLDPVIGALIRDSELPEEKTVDSLKGLQRIIKPYPYFHWRNLHSTLQKVVFDYYKNEDYYTAVFEGVTKYVNQIKKKTSSTKVDFELIKEAFSPDETNPPTLPTLSVTKKFKRPDGTDFKPLTIENISLGHGLLARAMWKAFRNPKAHETAQDLKNSGLYTEQDCLDALSLLSHLYYRLDNAEMT